MRIDVATAQELIQNYKQNHWTIINGCCPSLKENPNYPDVQDSRAVWFSLEELNAFIKAITAAGGTGIRFYFGEYSADIVNNAVNAMANNQNGMDNTVPANQLNARIANIGAGTGLQTIVMVPTSVDGNGNNADFNMVDHSFTFNNPGDLACENHGGFAPPPWPSQMAGNTYQATTGAYFLDL